MSRDPQHAGCPQPQIVVPTGALRVADVARRIGVAESTVRSYLSRRQIVAPAGYWGPWPWWEPAAIEAWLASRPGRGNRAPRPG